MSSITMDYVVYWPQLGWNATFVVVSDGANFICSLPQLCIPRTNAISPTAIVRRTVHVFASKG